MNTETAGVREIDTGALPDRYARGWHCLGPVENYRDGKPHGIEIFGTMLVVFADSQGELHVLDGYCRHMGGNLAQTLDIISETVRDRIRMQREVRVLTAQQRLTGYILAGLPIALAVLLNLINPGYMRELFEPGWIRLVPGVGILMQVVGFLVIRRIVDIEV